MMERCTIGKDLFCEFLVRILKKKKKKTSWEKRFKDHALFNAPRKIIDLREEIVHWSSKGRTELYWKDNKGLSFICVVCGEFKVFYIFTCLCKRK
jgi:hypothetical protein